MKGTKMESKRLLQVAHGRIIPEYSSAYALRCVRYLENYPERKLISVGGLIFKDETKENVKQYRSLIMTGIAYIKKGRLLEILISKGKWLRRKYLNDLKKEVIAANIVVFEGPWQYDLVKDLLNGKRVIYDAHNVEYILRKNDPWENFTKELESDLVRRSDRVITVSLEDAEQIMSIYQKESEKITTISEGFESPKATWNGADSKEIVFIGSAYQPNIVAAQNVIKLAGKLSDFTFKIIGSVCNSIKKKETPENVRLLGVLSEREKELEICNSFIAINPVESGSGRNMKINDYVAHGIPIITTEVGARGFESMLKNEFIIADISDFPTEIKKMASERNRMLDISLNMIEYAHNHSYSKTKEAAMELINSLDSEI